MATADQYAEWIVRNADKKGTPDFETVAQAYQLAKQEEQSKAAPVAESQPDSVGRQFGLFARSAARGLAGIPQVVTEPIRQLMVNPALRAAGLPQASSLTDASDAAGNTMGLPTPQNRTERIVDKAVEMGTGSGAMSAGALRLAELIKQFPTLSKAILPAGLEAFGQAPMVQATAGASGGAAGQQAKENGAGFFGQAASALGGSLLGAGAAAGVKSAVDAAKNFRLVTPEAVDKTIVTVLQNQGIDPQTIGPAVMRGMREHVAQAMKTGGQLDDAAVARLADYARVGATPTRGPVTLDPYTVTMQQNASKIAAATGSRDAKLPTIANENNKTLIDALTALEPSADATGLGSKIIGGVRAADDAMTANKNALYTTARDMAGGDIPLERGQFVDAITKALVKENKLAFLPEPVSKMLNTISKGQIVVDGVAHEVPFNANALDNLKTVIASAMRSADGNGRSALKIARDALESVPLNPIKRDFGNGQMVTQAGADWLKNADSTPAQVFDALNQARAAASQQFNWRESAKGIAQAVDESANPQTFLQNFVTSSAASPADVAKLLKAAGNEGKDAARSGVAQHLLDSAIGAGAKPDTGNFSGKSLEKALRGIGDAKLKLLFDADEIETLKSAARVGTYETFQPRGSAVNNSNTGAAVARILDTLGKYVKPIAKAIPFGEQAVAGPLEFLTMKAAERPALQIAPGLITQGTAPRGSFAAGLIAPSIYGAGLLTEK